jgi:hypothetical protein
LAPIVRATSNGEREIVTTRWGMPTPPKFRKGEIERRDRHPQRGWILAEPRAANGKCIANFSGPNASEFQFWRAGGRIVSALAETLEGCKEPKTGTREIPIFSPPLTDVVIGVGRLQFYSAPNFRCPMDGVFVIPKDELILFLLFLALVVILACVM